MASVRAPSETVLPAAAAAAVFLVCWGILHRDFYAAYQIVDTPVYASYGSQMADGRLPYRDFAVEYPPGALPVFLAPEWLPGSYTSAFGWLMAALGVATVAVVATVRRSAVGFVAIAPLLIGALAFTRFDLWPALLAVAALAALLRDRHRIAWALLAAAVLAKLWPAVLVPLAVTWTWRRRGGRETTTAVVVAAAVVAVVVVPFLVLAPHGLLESVRGQATRPLQVESIGASLVMTFGHPGVETSHGSQNIVGHSGLATLFGIAPWLVLSALWAAHARGRAEPARLVRYSAATVVAFVAFGKVLSPQFLIWLVPLVPLVRGRRGLAATALLAGALALTQVWFPDRYWNYADGGELAWVVLLRDVTLVALLVTLALPSRLELHR